MKEAIIIPLLLILLSPLSAQSDKKIVILHTNDLHSRLYGYPPEASYTPLTINDDNTTGGFARIATIIKNEKDANKGITMVVDAGDLVMGSLFQGIETQTGFLLRLIRTMGYDAGCIGNHEFDYGPGKLAEIVNSSVRNGEIPALLLSNAVFDQKEVADDELEKLFISGIIARKHIIDRGGLKIGFFSLLGKVADENAAFAAPVKFGDQIKVAKMMVKELEAEKCDLIICLSHSGVSNEKDDKMSGEDVRLAKKCEGIDVIISGHTHTKLEKPVIVNGIPIVQTGAFGEYVGKLSLNYNNGIVTIDNYSLIPVNDKIPGDPEIIRLIEAQKEILNEKILRPGGMEYDKSVAETDFILECNEQGDFKGSNLGPMVADAIHTYINKHSGTGTDISLVATGVIFSKISPGYQSAPDIFKVLPMGYGNDNIPGYPLSRVFVTGKELKNILEILQIAYKNTPANYCYYSGIRVEYNPGKMMLRKIKRIEIIHPDGNVTDVDFSKKNTTLYSITANSYMLEFVGIIKKMSFGLINVVPKDISGNPVTSMANARIDLDEERSGIQEGKEWLALMEYLSSMKDINGNGVPDIDKTYKVPVQRFFIVK